MKVDCELHYLPLDETTESTSSAIPTCTPTNKDANERSSLLKRIRRPCKPRYSPFCVKNKATLLILTWKFLFSLSLGVLLTPRTYLSLFADDLNVSFVAVTCGAYGSTAILFMFFPLAGFLADVKYGRYKVVLTTLWLVWLCLTISIPLLGLGILVHYLSHVSIMQWFLITIGILAAIVVLIGFVGFNANVIQFGSDQLHDAPSDHSSLFVHWYVWVFYLATSISKPVWSGVVDIECDITIPSAVVIAMIAIITVSILGVTLCFVCCKKKWFLIDTDRYGTRKNPYKLVYRVLRFAVEHKNPVRRSAFTFCEDELPSRIDFGKEKYGGPFSNEQVEDVKVFLGIFSVLLALGPTFATEIATNALLPTFAGHLQNISSNGCFSAIIVDNGTLVPIFITLFIPIHLCLLRPFIQNYIPGMMKRMGLGMVFFLVSLLCTFFVDTAGHVVNRNASCFLSGSKGEYIEFNTHVLTIQSFLNSVGYILLYVAAYEFICAQSPHSMKGLLIGVFFAINGLFQLLSIVALFLPFTFWRPQFPSCSFGYYFVNIFISIVGLVVFTCVAKRYRYRQRDEPSRVYIYAEEYYEKAQDEPNYDYDDYDNLNVETIN